METDNDYTKTIHPEECTPDDRKLRLLARMTACRQQTSCPDVDKSWAHFKSQHIEADQPRRSNRWALWASAAAGAAAMFVGFTMYINIFGVQTDYVALNYEATPRMVTLSSGDKLSDISDLDSISFYTPSQASSQPVPADSPLASSGTHTPASPNAIASAATAQRLSTPRGMDFKLLLHDGTEVWLNAESTIEFPSAFVTGERRVKLTGEAYFKVAHNEHKPFIVDLGDKTIRVLGTEFDVRNYAAETAQVILVNGSVHLCDTSNTTLAQLTPGQEASWKGGEDVIVGEADIYMATQWTEGLFYFDDCQLDMVLREIGRWYNYGVIFKHADRHAYRVHFSAMRTDELSRVIDDLNVICGFKIAIENKNIVVY